MGLREKGGKEGGESGGRDGFVGKEGERCAEGKG